MVRYIVQYKLLTNWWFQMANQRLTCQRIVVKTIWDIVTFKRYDSCPYITLSSTYIIIVYATVSALNYACRILRTYMYVHVQCPRVCVYHTILIIHCLQFTHYPQSTNNPVSQLLINTDIFRHTIQGEREREREREREGEGERES